VCVWYCHCLCCVVDEGMCVSGTVIACVVQLRCGDVCVW